MKPLSPYSTREQTPWDIVLSINEPKKRGWSTSTRPINRNDLVLDYRSKLYPFSTRCSNGRKWLNRVRCGKNPRGNSQNFQLSWVLVFLPRKYNQNVQLLWMGLGSDQWGAFVECTTSGVILSTRGLYQVGTYGLYQILSISSYDWGGDDCNVKSCGLYQYYRLMVCIKSFWFS